MNRLRTLLGLALLMVVVSCQEIKEPEVTYPENEIPVHTESNDAMQAFMTGLDFYDQGFIQKARMYFDEAISLDPEFVSAHMYRAYTSNSARDWATNRDAFLDMRATANEAEQLMMDMVQADMEDDLEEAVARSEELVEKYPESARALENLASYYNSQDKTEKARETWAKAIEVNPDFLPALTDLGFSYLFSSPKDYQKAQSYLEKAVAVAPESSRAQINLGDAYRAQNDLEKALASYMKAAELDSTDQVAFSKAGHANTFLGNMEAARKNYKDARAVSEFGTAAFSSEAGTYLYEGNPEQAMSFLDNAISSIEQMDIPESNKLWSIRGMMNDKATIAMHMGESEKLAGIIEQMRPITEQMKTEVNAPAFTANMNANMHFWDAMIKATAGDYEEAAALAEAIKTDKANSEDPYKLEPYHRVHAYVNFQQGKYEQALEHLSEMNPDNVYNKYWMAKSYQMMGDEEKAMALFEEVANDNFNSIPYALILGETKEILTPTEG